jgi:hypothetical protein
MKIVNIISCQILHEFLEMPPKRKILILVNPFSGRRLAAGNWVIA